MNKVLKWFLIVLSSLLALVAVICGAGWARINKTYNFPSTYLQIPSDAKSIARGQHIVGAISACQGCHSDQLQGKMMINNPLVAILPAPNLTPAGDAAMMSDEERTLMFRHGVDEEGKTFLIMPSSNFSKMSDEDLAAVIAYLKSLPPVENELPEKKIGPLGYLFAGLGLLNDTIQVSLIDHNESPSAPVEGITAKYGKYLVTIGNCAECHGANLAGASSDQGSPPGPNLTGNGPTKEWSQSDFLRALRTGIRPDGSKMSDLMPWKYYSLMTDDELQATWLYLRSLPVAPVKKSQ